MNSRCPVIKHEVKVPGDLCTHYFKCMNPDVREQHRQNLCTELVMVKLAVMVKVRLTIYPERKSPTLARQTTTRRSVRCRSCQIWPLAPSTLEEVWPVQRNADKLRLKQKVTQMHTNKTCF